MAEAKSTDPKRTEGKSGAVKPPVLDLKARSGGDKPEPTAPKAPPRETVSAPKTETAVSGRSMTGFGVGAAVAGGVLGLALAYGLAWSGYWPSASAQTVQTDPRLAQLDSAIPGLQAMTQTTQSGLAALDSRVAGLERADIAVAAPSQDIAALKGDIAALSARIAGLGSALPSNSTPPEVEALRTQIAGLGTRLDELGARVGMTEAGMRTLEASVSQTSATLAQQPADMGAVLQLPLVLSGLEAAFSTGRPYEAELATLRTALPDTAVPAVIATGAAAGLPRPDVIAAQFAAALPAMLARQPANPEAGWQDGALDWFRSAIALRPTGELEGDAPEAVVSRLEAAIARRDYGAAQTLLASLPAPMQAAAGAVPALLAAQAEASRFLDGLRLQALSGKGIAP